MKRDFSEFERMLNKNLYQVFLMSCPCTIPLNFTRHPWFVVNKKGTLSRWEVFSKKNLMQTSWSHLYFNGFYFSPFQGIAKYPFSRIHASEPRLLYLIEGDENSVAYKMIQLIESSPQTYPFCEKYKLTGPNSNTYVQWVLDKFPESNIKLPWRYIGKGFKSKNTLPIEA